MSIRATSAIILSACLLTATAGVASAQRYGDYNGGYDNAYNRSGRTVTGERLRNPAPYVGASDKYGYPVSGRGGACIKLCPGDNNPCDPIQYKTADNRCGSRF